MAHFKEGLRGVLSSVDIQKVLGSLQNQKIITSKRKEKLNDPSEFYRWTCKYVESVVKMDEFLGVLRQSGHNDQCFKLSLYPTLHK